MNGDHIDHFCSAIQLLNEGGSKITEPNAGITSDMTGRWTIGTFDTSKKNKKETPPMKEVKLKKPPALTELIYNNNAGVMEINKFFKVATPEQEDKLLNLMNNNKTKAAWNFIEDVLGIKFQGDGPWK